MRFQDEPGTVRWRAHFRAPPEAIYETLATDAGRARFWAESAVERDGTVAFRFVNGERWQGRVLAADPPGLWAVEYFGGSRAEFRMVPDGAGGTDLTLVETGVDESWRGEHVAGWIPVLLALKAAVDLGGDLRNRDPERTWERGYVDV